MSGPAVSTFDGFSRLFKAGCDVAFVVDVFWNGLSSGVIHNEDFVRLKWVGAVDSGI